MWYTDQMEEMYVIESKVREILASVTGHPGDVSSDADLYLDLGIASVHALQLLTDLEEQFGVSVPDRDFVEATSVAKLTAMMSRLVPKSSEGTARA